MPHSILATGNTGLDMEGGHDIAYQRILSACARHENPPKFFPDDSPDCGGLDIADKIAVCELLHKSQLAARSKFWKMVLMCATLKAILRMKIAVMRKCELLHIGDPSRLERPTNRRAV
jgi:hypothetical protein